MTHCVDRICCVIWLRWGHHGAGSSAAFNRSEITVELNRLISKIKIIPNASQALHQFDPEVGRTCRTPHFTYKHNGIPMTWPSTASERLKFWSWDTYYCIRITNPVCVFLSLYIFIYIHDKLSITAQHVVWWLLTKAGNSQCICTHVHIQYMWYL